MIHRDKKIPRLTDEVKLKPIHAERYEAVLSIVRFFETLLRIAIKAAAITVLFFVAFVAAIVRTGERLNRRRF